MIYFYIAVCALVIVCSYFTITSSTKYKVLRLLEKHNVPYKTWDADGSDRTLYRLIESVEDGEIELESRSDGKLVLHVFVAVVTIRRQHKKEWFELREHRRNGPDNLFVPRQFSGSLGGKIKRFKGECPFKAIRREIGEELGHSEPRFRDPGEYAIRDDFNTEIVGPQPSDGRLGVYDVYHRHHFSCEISNGLYHHTYTEIHPHKEDRQFFWVNI